MLKARPTSSCVVPAIFQKSVVEQKFGTKFWNREIVKICTNLLNYKKKPTTDYCMEMSQDNLI